MCVCFAHPFHRVRRKGFIAGVTNPLFEEQSSWWDVLCDINTGKITISSRLLKSTPAAPMSPSMSQTGGVRDSLGTYVSASSVSNIASPTSSAVNMLGIAATRLEDGELQLARSLVGESATEFVNQVCFP